MRIMSLDVGSRTIGIACSDALLMTAQGIETIRRTSLEKDFNRLQELIAEYEVHELVVGMPKNMNGTKGERAEKTEEFVAKMKEVIDLPVTYWDERLSTVMAERQLIAADVSRKKRKSVIDKMAAVVASIPNPVLGGAGIAMFVSSVMLARLKEQSGPLREGKVIEDKIK